MDASNGPRQLPFFVGRYRCEEYLGGGMADIYRARDTDLPRDVAIKILKAANQHDEEYRRAFLDEAQLASQCCYENIVSIYDRGEYEGCLYIVMEFLRGENLATLIENKAHGDIKKILRIALQTARALENVHAQNIVHRDLKPQNLHVDRAGRVKLVDFGIAKSIEWNKTQAGLTKGTAYYMAPEQVLGQPVSFRTDIWAFGVVLFEMLTNGKRPFQGATTIDALWAAIVKATPEYELLNSCGAPEAVRKMVHRCLEKRPERRYPDFHAIAEELEVMLATTSPGAAAKPEIKRRIPDWKEIWEHARARPRTGVIALAASAALSLSVIIWALASSTTPKDLKFPSGDMVLVPGGSALLGDRLHMRTVNVPPFYVDVTEVSNKAYAEFIRNTGHPEPLNFREDQPDYPVVNVTFYDAQAFAYWAGKRLLTDEEWEKTARGSDGRLFPWGSESDPRLANVANNPALAKHTLLPVTSFAPGASPFGALNLCGNVWEWVNASHAPEPAFVKAMQEDHLPVNMNDAFYSIRGGYYGKKLVPELVVDFSTFPAKLGSPVIGFRCGRGLKGR